MYAFALYFVPDAIRKAFAQVNVKSVAVGVGDHAQTGSASKGIASVAKAAVCIEE